VMRINCSDENGWVGQIFNLLLGTEERCHILLINIKPDELITRGRLP